MYKVGDARFQCVNNHYAKFKNKDMKTIGKLQITRFRHHQSILDGKMSKFNTPKTSENIHEMCTK